MQRARHIHCVREVDLHLMIVNPGRHVHCVIFNNKSITASLWKVLCKHVLDRCDGEAWQNSLCAHVGRDGSATSSHLTNIGPMWTFQSQAMEQTLHLVGDAGPIRPEESSREVGLDELN